MNISIRGNLTVALLFWSAVSLQGASLARAACGTTAMATAGVNTIQSAVDAAPAILMLGDHCVVVAPGAYSEQVSIRNIDTNGFSIVIEGAAGGG